ncbi:CLUMA_CG010893, isoform A [Clunio marinus]|uniref:CLUMA_CG010893, isoform A n=1 Tax=Clunio marinus TaxID=568069 RepID=A0A1J1IB96_9DIPT|nr:CLUMA_CG010893, isoform A [Clunio marinus]
MSLYNVFFRNQSREARRKTIEFIGKGNPVEYLQKNLFYKIEITLKSTSDNFHFQLMRTLFVLKCRTIS